MGNQKQKTVSHHKFFLCTFSHFCTSKALKIFLNQWLLKYFSRKYNIAFPFCCCFHLCNSKKNLHQEHGYLDCQKSNVARCLVPLYAFNLGYVKKGKLAGKINAVNTWKRKTNLEGIADDFHLRVKIDLL
jgi:hypothetical protein